MENGDAGFVYANSPCNPPDMIDPMAQYDHDEGTAVIGGFVVLSAVRERLAAIQDRRVDPDTVRAE